MAKNNPKPTKRTRKGGQRGKTGCPTCRARHVKCDERRPSCLQCTSTGRKCDGYECVRTPTHQEAPLSLEHTRFYNSKTSPWDDCRVALTPTLGLSSNERGNRFFYSFLHGCIPSLTEDMDSEFCQRAILRAASSPAVQHAAIALGAVYEEHVAPQKSRGRLASSRNDKRIESPLYYATAIQILQHRITESSQTPEMLEEIMIACLIFIVMEILRGDDVAAVTHLDGALKIYNCLQPIGNTFTHARENQAAFNMNNALKGLTNTFSRLDVQSVLYMGSRTPWSPQNGTSVWSPTNEDIPVMFETFLDARDSLYAHLTKIMSFVTPPEGADKCFPGWSPHPDRGFDIYTIFHGSKYRDYKLPKAATQRRDLTRILSRWKSAFQGFLQKRTAKIPEAMAGCALLWLAYHTGRIQLAVSYTDDECCYDEQLPSFKKIVEQAQTYLKCTTHSSQSQLPRDTNEKVARNMPSLKPKKDDFKVYSTVCYPLYYTALKCRYKPLRQLALDILRNTDREGIWDADMLTRLAEFVVSVEEDSIEPDSHNIPADVPPFGVPEKNRIHCLSLSIDKALRTIWLRYSRRNIATQGEISRSSDPLKRWKIDNTILTWRAPATESAETIDPRQFLPDLPPSATPWENQTLCYRSPQAQY